MLRGVPPGPSVWRRRGRIATLKHPGSRESRRERSSPLEVGSLPAYDGCLRIGKQGMSGQRDSRPSSIGVGPLSHIGRGP